MVSLSAERVAFYVRHGYVVLRNVLPLDLLEQAQRQVLKTIGPWAEARGKNSNADPGALYYSGRPHFIFKSDEPPIMALALCDEIKEITDFLFSRGAQPEMPKLVHWYRHEGHKPTPHIDTPPGPFVPMPYHIGTLAAPIWTRADAGSGYTLVFPESHLRVERWLADHDGATLEDLREDISRYDGSRHARIPFETGEGTALLLNPGDVFMMHSLLAHAAVSPRLGGIEWRGTAFFKFRNPGGEALSERDIFKGHSPLVHEIAASPESVRYRSTVSWKSSAAGLEIEQELAAKTFKLLDPDGEHDEAKPVC